MQKSGRQHTSSGLEYREDIQFMRGISIFLVVFYHLKHQFFQSGFLGVDVFFVISGYLMSALYPRQLAGAWRTFLLRRAKRILPAYFVVLLLTTLIAAFLVLPHELAELMKYNGYSLLGLPNLGFWMDDGYFAKELFRPTLHFWSLGIELQFYLFVPLMVLISERSKAISIFLAIASVLICFGMTTISAKSSFFLIPFRLWEFFIGFFAFQYFGRQFLDHPRLQKLLASLGALALIFIFALSTWAIPENQHPKYASLFVCLATGFILVVGLPAWFQRFSIFRFGGLVGQYSYSLYLIHFPLIIFYFYLPFGGNSVPDFSFKHFGVLAILMSVLSFLLFRWVEVPFRKYSNQFFLKVLGLGMVAPLLVFAFFLVPFKRSQTEAEVLKIIDSRANVGSSKCSRFEKLIDLKSMTCQLKNESAPTYGKSFLLLGNSHSKSIKDPLLEMIQKIGGSLWVTKDNCSFGEGFCTVEKVLQEIRNKHFAAVIFHASPGSVKAEEVIQLAEHAEQEGFRLILIDPVPVWKVHVPMALYYEWIKKMSSPDLIQTQEDYLHKNELYFKKLDAYRNPRFARYSIGESYCNPYCQTKDERGYPLYFDSNHLTLAGADKIKSVLEKIVKTHLDDRMKN